MLSKERAADMYRLSAYFLARTTSDLPLDLILPVLFLVVVYFMAGLTLDAGSIFLSLLTVFLCIVAAQVLELLLGLTIVYFARLIDNFTGIWWVMTGTGTSYRGDINGHEEGDHFGLSDSHDLHACRRVLC